MRRLDGSDSGDRPGRQPPNPQRLPVNPRRHKVAPERRRRVVTACNACNIRRVKCSGDHPCDPCMTSSRECVYPAVIEKVSITRTELDELRRKVDVLERALRDTVPDATRRHDLIALISQDASGAAASARNVASATASTAGAPVGTPAETSSAAQHGVLPRLHPHQSQLLHPQSHSQPHSQAYSQSHLQPHSQPQLQSQPEPPPQPQPRPQLQLQSHHTRVEGPDELQNLNPTHHQHEDEQASTEGRLLHDPDGHARFLGETSGATFLDYLKEFMSTVFHLAYRDLQPGVEGSAFLSSLGRYQTYDSRRLHERDVDPLWLPQRHEMQLMLSESRFFIQDGNGNWPSGGIYWWGDLSSVPSLPPIDPNSHPVARENCRHLAFYHTVFAVASQASKTPAQRPPLPPNVSEYYFSRACLLLGNPLDITRFTINDVTTLALMGFYLIEMNRRDAAYMCVSNAMHISIMHGTHRGWVDESGTRIFWTLYVLDRWLSCLMGRPPTIMDDAIRLPLPCDAPSMPSAAGLKAHVELSRISGHIVCNTYRVSPGEKWTGSVRHSEDAIRMLDQWQENLPPILQLSANGLSDDPACCLLHMGCNQLLILTIRPVFFAAVKKTFAERLVTRQSSLNSHPQLSHLRRCVIAAEHNIRLARHILALNHPRKLLQAGLHFIFNAAICLMLQDLIYIEDVTPKDPHARDHDLDFVIARFEEESQVESNYGRDCAAVLRDLRALVQRLQAPIKQRVVNARPGELPQQLGQGLAATRTTNIQMGQPWPQKAASNILQQPIHVEQGHTLSVLFEISRTPQARSISTSMSNLQRRAVAGSFIFKFPDDDTTKKPQVALFRRSAKVRTYPHKYAPISGSVEETDANPLATAWRELQEETTLTNTSLRLFRQGKPYSFVDESVNREWTINPFSFILKSEKEGGRGEASIQLDWEHQGYEWFDPDAINESDDFQGVPRILDSFRRVWFNIDLGEEAGRRLGAGLMSLQRDHDSGAHQLASKALEIFIDVIKRLDTNSREAWWKNVRTVAWHLWKNGRESMGAPILRVMISSLGIIKDKMLHDSSSLEGSIEATVQALQQFSQRRQGIIPKVGGSLHDFLTTQFSEAEPLKILTLSSSSTILSGIMKGLENRKTPLEVRVLESRPLFEGVKMGNAIASFANTNSIKTNVTVYTDASVGLAAEDVDVVLIGADLIDNKGNVSNKTGSLPAVLAAKHVSPSVKVVALFDMEKVLPFEPPVKEENDPQEVVQAWGDLVELGAESNARVKVKNVYFEWVSSDLIDYYVTEYGITSAERIAESAENVQKGADRFFNDL
ncbi:hypothetical protein B0J13DRAFT_627143 [Dactylonectria estremocensis]|uniref:Nudix hydrolase domain-containing protein n=1 Tax=Dactylonectria estremocensis TaxID=1079267 RepID=A0A9P9E3E4_9HYPO|nr:hypothetical protein B0J13DRAFT_627143 [Dactylonectria estremocensis]